MSSAARSKSIRHPHLDGSGATLVQSPNSVDSNLSSSAPSYSRRISRRPSRDEIVGAPQLSPPSHSSIQEYNQLLEAAHSNSQAKSYEFAPSRHAPGPPSARVRTPTMDSNSSDIPSNRARVRNSLHKSPPAQRKPPKSPHEPHSPSAFNSYNNNPNGTYNAAPPRPSRANTANLNDIFPQAQSPTNPSTPSRRLSTPQTGADAPFMSDAGDLAYHTESGGTRSRSGTASKQNKKSGGVLSFMSGTLTTLI
jgi:p21-activated kinase 1